MKFNFLKNKALLILITSLLVINCAFSKELEPANNTELRALLQQAIKDSDSLKTDLMLKSGL